MKPTHNICPRSGALSCLQIVVSSAFVFSTVNATAASAARENYPCREKLSEKSAMIFDDVQKKRTDNANLEEIWKEATRDLITANRIGREEATVPAMQALNCLRAPE